MFRRKTKFPIINPIIDPQMKILIMVIPILKTSQSVGSSQNGALQAA